MVDEKEHDFQKKLADLQIKAGALFTLSSIMMALGITLILTSLSLNLDAFGAHDDKSKLFTIIGNGYLDQGGVMFFVGLIMLVVGTREIRKKINALD